MVAEIVSAADCSFFSQKEAELARFDPTILLPPFPSVALVELANACNHACVFCANPRMQRSNGILPPDLFERFVRDAVYLGLKQIGLYTTGEPFMVKNLRDYVAIAKASRMEYIFLTTNGSLATPDRVVPVVEAGLDSIKFSINAGTRDTYALIHGRDDFDKVIENLTFLADYREQHSLVFKILASCILTRFTDNERGLLKRKIGPLVDEIAFFGVDGQSGQSLDEFSHLMSQVSTPFPDRGHAKPCAMLWNRIHLTCEGYLSLCCVDYENNLTYADFNIESLDQAWSNQVIKAMRTRHVAQKLEGTLCHNCLYGTKHAVRPISSIARDGPHVKRGARKQLGRSMVDDRILRLLRRA